MDGVLWHGETPLPGLLSFFAFLRDQQIDFILATNNSSRLPEQYSDKLARFSVRVAPEKVLTSAQASAAYLATVAEPGARVYAIGEEGVHRSLQQRGFLLTEEEAEYVVVGWDRQLTWDKLTTASLLIHHGAQFIGTNPDTSYPTELGPAPGNGAQLAAIQTATGVTPLVVGKPEPWMYEEAMRRMGASPETTGVVGDRVETDIAGGVRARIATVLVLSGIGTEADVAASPTKPDLVCGGIGELIELWGRELRRQHGDSAAPVALRS
jgi:4-nitrophenyl phosphatase